MSILTYFCMYLPVQGVNCPERLSLWWHGDGTIMSMYVVNMKWNQDCSSQLYPRVLVAFKTHGEICGLFLACLRTLTVIKSLLYFYSVAQLNTWPLRWWRPLVKKLASTTSAVTCGALASSSTSCWVDTHPLWVAVEQTVVGTGESPAKPARYTTYLAKIHGFLGKHSVSKAVKVQNFPWNRSRSSHLVS